MKLILAIIKNDDSVETLSALMKEGFFVTKLATTGGFLMVGNTTLLVGTEDERVDEVMSVFRLHCSPREHKNLSRLNYGPDFETDENGQVVIGSATIFVLNVDRFEKL